MLPALPGRKVGMTRIFEDDGLSIMVTVIQLDQARLLDRRTVERDGYHAVRIAHDKPSARMTKVRKKMFSSAGINDCGGITELRCNQATAQQLNPGQAIDCTEVFNEGDSVDVLSVSKGKGFAGTIKRFNFAQQDNSHGNSLSHRVAGTTGQNQLPGRVFPGKKMPGHMGNKRVRILNLKIIRVIPEERVLLVKGSVPGWVSGRVLVSHSKRGTKGASFDG